MPQILHLSPAPGSDSWLLTEGDSAVLLETGYACTARQMLPLVTEALAGRTLQTILLSHSHYDHASATPQFSAAFPQAEIAAAEHTAHVFTRPGARRVMREMNAAAAKHYGCEPDDSMLDALRVDRILRDGDAVALGSARLQVWETPGHTKCSLSFYDADASLLLAAETFGIPDRPLPAGEPPAEDIMVIPSCMAGVESSLRAIKRAAAAAPQSILIPHTGVVSGEAAAFYLRKAAQWLTYGRDLVLDGARRGTPLPELTAEWKKLFYTPHTALIQPEAAFDLNAKNILPAIAREYGIEF